MVGLRDDPEAFAAAVVIRGQHPAAFQGPAGPARLDPTDVGVSSQMDPHHADLADKVLQPSLEEQRQPRCPTKMRSWAHSCGGSAAFHSADAFLNQDRETAPVFS